MKKRMIVIVLAGAVAACGATEAREGAARPQPAAAPASPAKPSVTVVPNRAQVCMVNDQDMGVAQIPVEVEGKTYFGCCEMCKGRLQADRKVREAVDPVSGKTVDKATAVIGRTKEGRVLYFENAGNLARYAASSSKPKAGGGT